MIAQEQLAAMSEPCEAYASDGERKVSRVLGVRGVLFAVKDAHDDEVLEHVGVVMYRSASLMREREALRQVEVLGREFVIEVNEVRNYEIPLFGFGVLS